MSSPDVTVVVASRNRREDLLVTLPRHEAPVILVDNASTDGTVDAVRRGGAGGRGPGRGRAGPGLRRRGDRAPPPLPRRDAPARRQAAVWRSRLLTGLMRYPASELPRLLLGAVRAGEPGLRGLARAVPDVPAALRRRRPVPSAVWADVRRLAAA